MFSTRGSFLESIWDLKNYSKNSMKKVTVFILLFSIPVWKGHMLKNVATIFDS